LGGRDIYFFKAEAGCDLGLALECCLSVRVGWGKNEIFTIKKISKELKKRRERERGEREGKTIFF